MDTVPTPDRDPVIARIPFVDETHGEIIARHGDTGPTVTMHLTSTSGDESHDVVLTPLEAKVLADELGEFADTAQHAGWTPHVIADVREHYLPGATDQQVIARLDRLVERVGSSPVQHGSLTSKGGLVLAAEAHLDAAHRAEQTFSTVRDEIAELRRGAADLLRAATVRHDGNW